MDARKRRFTEFRKAKLNAAGEEYRTSGELKRTLNHYDKVIMGSDRVS